MDEMSQSKKQNEALKKKLEEAVDMFRKVQEQLKERDKVIILIVTIKARKKSTLFPLKKLLFWNPFSAPFSH